MEIAWIKTNDIVILKCFDTYIQIQKYEHLPRCLILRTEYYSPATTSTVLISYKL